MLKGGASIIELLEVGKHFKTKTNVVEAINNVSLTIESGDIFGVIGESGAGKSTLLRFINGLEVPDSGKVIIDGLNVHSLSHKELRHVRQSISMIFQQFNLLQNKTVAENVSLPLKLHYYDSHLSVEDVLEFVGLADKANAYPSQLSGGQKQRVGIARALITRPAILLCDEPTSALDATMTDEIVALLQKAHQALNMTIVLVSHELDVVRQLCDHVAILEAGKLVNLIRVKPSVKGLNKVSSYHQRVLEVLANE